MSLLLFLYNSARRLHSKVSESHLLDLLPGAGSQASAALASTAGPLSTTKGCDSSAQTV